MICLDDLTGPEILQLLQEHTAEMHTLAPAESVHTLSLEDLRKPGVAFWTLWEDDKLAGCVALKQLDSQHGEIKSMRTATEFRRRGIASKLLQHVLDEAMRRGYRRLSLETGSMAFFAPAHQLYARFGFQPCGPFAHYRDDPNSFFMTREI